MFGYQAVLEDSKEADKTTGRATHRISKGIHDKVPFYIFHIYGFFFLKFSSKLISNFTKFSWWISLGSFCYEETWYRWESGHSADPTQS